MIFKAPKIFPMLPSRQPRAELEESEIRIFALVPMLCLGYWVLFRSIQFTYQAQFRVVNIPGTKQLRNVLQWTLIEVKAGNKILFEDLKKYTPHGEEN
jgi:hypothetical protein